MDEKLNSTTRIVTMNDEIQVNLKRKDRGEYTPALLDLEKHAMNLYKCLMNPIDVLVHERKSEVIINALPLVIANCLLPIAGDNPELVRKIVNGIVISALDTIDNVIKDVKGKSK